MKYVMNQGVRDTVAELDQVAMQFDELTTQLANPNCQATHALNAGYDRQRLQERMASLACRILSHATRGKRYPNMTDGVYRAKEWL